MANSTNNKKDYFAETKNDNNEFVKRFCIPSTSGTNKVLFSEEFYMVSDKDLAKKFEIEKSGVRPKFVGRTKEGKYYIFGFADFAKLFDKNAFKNDLMKVAMGSLREDPSSDDYFKMLYSNTLRHVAYLLKSSSSTTMRVLRSSVYEFLISNFGILDQDIKELIIEREGIYGM